MREPRSGKESRQPRQPVSLKQLAAHLGLDPATVSVVLNDVPGRSIPQKTRDRIKAAARELNYHPNLLARSLRSRQSKIIGILVPELGDGYHTQVYERNRRLSHQCRLLLLHRAPSAQAGVDRRSTRGCSSPAGPRASSPSILCSIMPFPFRWLLSPVIDAFKASPISALDHHRAAELTLSHLHALGSSQDRLHARTVVQFRL